MKSGGDGRKTARWTYLPAPEDPATITTLTFENGRAGRGRAQGRASNAAMRVLLQRVREAQRHGRRARVTGAIGPGLLVLAGIADSDTEDDRAWLASKIVNLRVFDDDAGVMNRSVRDTGGAILAVSQFTLYASTRKGNRPSWSARRAARSRAAALRRVRRRAVAARSASRFRPACSART